MIPQSRPKLGHLEALNILGAHGVYAKVAILGVRGYYLDTLGVPGKNDRALYDDAIFLVAPQAFLACNANTDPGASRRGHGTSESTKGMASLKPGTWLYKRGKHKGQYDAFIQAKEVTVLRDADSKVPEKDIVLLDGIKTYPDTGYFGINIHRGGAKTVSSIGCQTIPPSQWLGFQTLAYSLMKQYNQTTIPYCLTWDRG